MSDFSKINIDRLFNKKANEPEGFEFREDAWEHMNHLLEEDDRRRYLIFWWRFAAVAIVLIAIVATFFFYNNNNTVQTITTVHTNAPEIIQESASDDIAPTNVATVETPSPPITTINTFVEKKKKTSSVRKDKLNQANQKSVSATQEKTTGSKTKSPLHKVENPTMPIEKGLITQAIKETLPEKELTRLPLVSLAKMPINTPVFALSNSAIPLEDEKPKGKQRHLGIGLSSAFEYNFVGMEDMMKKWEHQAFSVGLNVEYASKHFSILTGINYAQRTYEAGAGEYNVPLDFWAARIAPTTTMSKLTILEIPLQVRYYPKSYDQSGVYAGIGLSSYVMLNEQYQFYYPEVVPNQKMGMEMNNEYQHWFNVLTFSVGYQYWLKDRVAIKATPSFQMALNGMGNGKMDLYTLSFDLGFTYKLH